MDRTPMTKEEIALELVKLIAPSEKPVGAMMMNIDKYSNQIAKAYNTILKTISTPPKSE
ncbi:hypothetical protein O8C96_04435 [Aliarcobacter butzleri]|uniref:hypothetical protein n=1 Tax=Aliarcobacter butzleri TaxID=28197 RepID=UPI00263DCA3A|nr:hypothetical protein [Aliarcobacter butzleri]MDN5044969.1 hypothetical protein [Aliarcobacter butzleri]